MNYPDDLIHADVNGVTIIPKEIAREVAEAVILDTLRQFGPDLNKLKEARKESKRLMDVLRKQVAVRD